MKKISTYLFLMLCISNCKKNDTEPIFPSPYELTPHWGTISYLINGKNADTVGVVSKKNTTKIAAVYRDKDSIFTLAISRFTVDNQHFLRETIHFQNIRFPPQKGIFKFGGTPDNFRSLNDSLRKLVSLEYWTWIEDNRPLNQYYLNDAKQSTIEITDFNPTTQEVKGKFNIFCKSPINYEPSFPNFISMTEGYFSTKFFKEN